MVFIVIKGGAEPALTRIMDFGAHPIAAGPAAQGGKDIHQKKRK